MKVNVGRAIGRNCLTPEAGQRLYEQIVAELRAGHPVELDFQGATVFASPFFNASIGQLLRDIKPDDLNRLLKVTRLAAAGEHVLRRVIETANQYYEDPGLRKALGEILREQEEER